jgi:lambda repressor-like predicted transcriptional regulator
MNNKPDKIIQQILAERGMAVRVAKACGIDRAAVYQWQRVPVARVHEVAELLDMSPEEIRPDIFRKKARKKPRR